MVQSYMEGGVKDPALTQATEAAETAMAATWQMYKMLMDQQQRLLSGEPLEDEVQETTGPPLDRDGNPLPKKKWQLCRFHRIGKCQQGKNCQFAHSEAEIDDRIVPELDPGQVPEQDTRLQKKMSLCKWWESGRGCHMGKLCGFAHGHEELFTTGRAIVADAARMSKYTHCKFFALGRCNKGKDCSQAHGAHEIGTPRTDVGALGPRKRFQERSPSRSPPRRRST